MTRRRTPCFWNTFSEQAAQWSPVKNHTVVASTQHAELLQAFRCLRKEIVEVVRFGSHKRVQRLTIEQIVAVPEPLNLKLVDAMRLMPHEQISENICERPPGSHAEIGRGFGRHLWSASKTESWHGWISLCLGRGRTSWRRFSLCLYRSPNQSLEGQSGARGESTVEQFVENSVQETVNVVQIRALERVQPVQRRVTEHIVAVQGPFFFFQERLSSEFGLASSNF